MEEEHERALRCTRLWALTSNRKYWNFNWSFLKVGTPDYISPEVFQPNGYTLLVRLVVPRSDNVRDVIRLPPFCSETPQETYQKVVGALACLRSHELITQAVID